MKKAYPISRVAPQVFSYAESQLSGNPEILSIVVTLKDAIQGVPKLAGVDTLQIDCRRSDVPLPAGETRQAYYQPPIIHFVFMVRAVDEVGGAVRGLLDTANPSIIFDPSNLDDWYSFPQSGTKSHSQ